MRSIRARVANGRIVVDQPTSLPEGTILDLVLDDEGDDLSSEERGRLNEAITRSWEAVRQGLVRPGVDVLSDLRKP